MTTQELFAIAQSLAQRAAALVSKEAQECLAEGEEARRRLAAHDELGQKVLVLEERLKQAMAREADLKQALGKAAAERDALARQVAEMGEHPDVKRAKAARLAAQIAALQAQHATLVEPVEEVPAPAPDAAAAEAIARELEA